MTLPDYLKDPTDTTKKIWGTLEKIDKRWYVKGHPYMISMVKRIFPGSDGRTRGEASFPASKRLIEDLSWLMFRFPLEIKSKVEWMNDLKSAREYFEIREQILQKPTKVETNYKFKGELKEFQKEGLSFLLNNPRSLLADEMGLGKTPTALAWLTNYSSPYLIILPPHLIRQWQCEIDKFLGQEPIIHIIRGLKPYKLPKANIYIIHYLLLRGWKEYLPRFKFNACVFDEIQELRHMNSDKYSAASLISESVNNVIGLSGTPIHNYGGEMYSILNILEYHCLGDYSSFSREWCSYYGSSRVSDPKLFGDYLKSEGLLLRRTKEEVLKELPPLRRVVQNIDVDKGRFDSLISPVIEYAKKIPEMDKLVQKYSKDYAVKETRRITGLAKAKYVCEFVASLLEAGESVILYGHHHDVMDEYNTLLKKYNPFMISGRQNEKAKHLAQNQYMSGKTNLVLVALRSGTGLNLQRTKCVVFGELDWSPATHGQCESRAHRMEVKDSVLSYYLVSSAGTDLNMQETLGLKTSQFVNIMGDRIETDEDKMMAQVDSKKFIDQVIERLQKETIGNEEKSRKKIKKTLKTEDQTNLNDVDTNQIRDYLLDNINELPELQEEKRIKKTKELTLDNYI